MTIPFVSKRVIRPTRADLTALLTSDDVEKPPETAALDPATQTQLNAIPTGSIALVYTEPGKEPGDPDLNLELVGWKGKMSVRAYVPKQERIHYLRLLGGDTSKFEKNKFQERREKQEVENLEKRERKKEEKAKEEAVEVKNEAEVKDGEKKEVKEG